MNINTLMWAISICSTLLATLGKMMLKAWGTLVIWWSQDITYIQYIYIFFFLNFKTNINIYISYLKFVYLMYIYMYLCIYVYIYIYMYICIYKYTFLMTSHHQIRWIRVPSPPEKILKLSLSPCLRWFCWSSLGGCSTSVSNVISSISIRRVSISSTDAGLTFTKKLFEAELAVGISKQI